MSGIYRQHHPERTVFYRVLFHYFDQFLAEFFKGEVFSLLLREGLISETLVEKIASWRHSGFSVHSKVCYRIINHLKLTFVAQRPPPPNMATKEILMAAE